jgi:hypothetical protein
MRRLRKRVRTGAQEQEPSDKPDIKRPPDRVLSSYLGNSTNLVIQRPHPELPFLE